MTSNPLIFPRPFLFVRHGETEANAAGLIAGMSESPLTERGRRQAEVAAKILTPVPVGAIWCSPLRRATDTAAIIARATGHEVRIVPELAERNWGDWEGHPRRLYDTDASPPNGESLDAFTARIVVAMGKLAPPWPPLIVGHSGVARVLRTALPGLDAKERLENARPCRFVPIASDGTHWRVEYVGE
jgi:probable phosphoglycerate mutase